MSNLIFKIIGVVFMLAIVSRVMIVPLLTELKLLLKLKRKGVSAIGKIVGFLTKKDLDNYTQYAKIIKYSTYLSEEIIFESRDFSFRKPIVGSDVNVLYDQNNPKNAVENFTSIFTFKCFLLVLVFTILSILIYSVFKHY